EARVFADGGDQPRREVTVEVGKRVEVGVAVIRKGVLEEGARGRGLRLGRGRREEQQDHRPPPSSRIVFHSSSRTGATDRRDWRINSILASPGSALICLSVTGPNGRTGSTAIETQF